jgi:alkanesulfonate monooxygenase SsuD/methylene tetrahydromethanopterin reductase-like flavin-dependent oxidoreductase (luciferase family)
MCTPQQVLRYRALLDEAAAEVSRPRPRLATWIMTGLEPGPEDFRQAANQLVAYLHPPGYGEQLMDAGFGDLVQQARSGRVAPAEIPEALPLAFGLFGSPAEIVAKMADYKDAGMDRIGVCPVTASDHGGARLLAELARLR